MKLGAKVPDETLFRPELDLSRFPVTGDRGDDSCDTDELRRCPLGGSNPFEDVMMADLGRACDGAGEGEPRANGLARFGEPFGPFT